MNRHTTRTQPRASWTLVLATTLLIAACGGDEDDDGTGGGPGGADAPRILAGVQSFAAGHVPPQFGTDGNNTTASVRVVDAAGTDIPDALVTVNGTALQFAAVPGVYHGRLFVAPASDVHVQVHVDGQSYAISGQHLDGYPELVTPASDAAWSRTEINTVSWQHSLTVPTTGQVLSVLGIPTFLPADPQPFQLVFNVPPSLNSFAIPANELPEGEYLLVVGVSRTVPVPAVPTGSVLSLTAATYRNVIVTAAGE